MLQPRQQINPDIIHQRQIASAIRRGMNERGSARPVLVGSVRVKNLWQHSIRLRSIEKSRRLSGLRLALRRVLERKNIGRIKKRVRRLGVAGGLREGMIEAAHSRAPNVIEHPIDRLFSVLVRIES